MTAEKEFKLRCSFGSVRMCMLIMKIASLFDSAILISRGDEGSNSDDIIQLMIVGSSPYGEEFPSPVVKVSASGPDASAAVDAIVGLFPKHDVPERCNRPGCNNPAVLLGPAGKDGFHYRCSISKWDQQHNWTVPL
jgi:phosphotransferase system HPr-like phosphotransfer protein